MKHDFFLILESIKYIKVAVKKSNLIFLVNKGNVYKKFKIAIIL